MEIKIFKANDEYYVERTSFTPLLYHATFTNLPFIVFHEKVGDDLTNCFYVKNMKRYLIEICARSNANKKADFHCPR